MLADYGLIALFLLVAFFFAITTLLLPTTLRFLRIVPKKPNPVKTSTYECGMQTIGKSWVQFNFRYYFYALLFVILLVSGWLYRGSYSDSLCYCRLCLCLEKEGSGMEVEDRTKRYIYSDAELDRTEGEEIEALKARSQEPIPDPDRWLDEELRRGILLTTVDAMLNWARRSSLWPVT